MDYKYFIRQKIDDSNGAGLIIKFNIPPMNALASDVLDELSRVLDDIENEIRVVIFTGEGKAFIAGADIKAMKQLTDKAATEFSHKGQNVFNKLESSSFVSIAAINGFALGGGLELALACDFRFATEKSILGLPEVTLGLIPGFGGTQRLTKIAGQGTAMYLISTGRMTSAAEALNFNIIQKVCSEKDLMDEAQKAAKAILKNGPLAVRHAKSLVYEASETNLDVGLESEASKFGLLFQANEPKEGMSAFIEKRKAGF